MDFQLTEEQAMWKKSVRDFAEKVLAPVVFKHDRDSTFPHEVMGKMTEMKLWGVFVPKEYGGAGGTNKDWVIMMEEIGRVDGGMGISILGHCHFLRSLMFMGTDEQKNKYLPAAAGEGSFAGFALTEPDAGTDAASIATTAKKQGAKYILNGNKVYITNAGMADAYIVFARTDPGKGSKGISAFIVDKDSPGFSIGTIEDKLGIRTSMSGEIVLDDCEVPEENILGEENRGFAELMKVFAVERLGNSAVAVGTAQAAMEWAIKYTMERPAFGKRVSDFQGVKWMLADMAVEIEAARLLVLKGADNADNGLPHIHHVAMGKILSNEMCMRVTTNAMQLFGAHGYSKSFPVERFFRDAKMYAIGGGTTQIQRTIVARDLLK